MRPIKEGDVIDLFWSDGEAAIGQTVISMPADVGDLLYTKTSDGTICGINVSASIFVQMVKQPNANEDSNDK